MKQPRGIWQRRLYTLFWKGVLLELEMVVKMMVKEDGGILSGTVSFFFAGTAIFFFGVILLFSCPSSSTSRFLFLHHSGIGNFPLTIKLSLSSSTRSISPCKMLWPRAMQRCNCCGVMFLYAGDLILCVQGSPFPMILSSIIRAKQWSRVTGHFFCRVALAVCSTCLKVYRT